MTDNHTTPNRTTRHEESAEAKVTAEADRMPTPEEERAAERNRLDPNVADATREAYERGAGQRGEGRVD